MIPKRKIEKYCNAVGIDYRELVKRNRKKELVIARYIIMRALRQETITGTIRYKYTEAQCGEVFLRDHATVIHGCKVIEQIIDTNYPRWANEMVNRFNDEIKHQKQEKVILGNLLRKNKGFYPFIYESCLKSVYSQ